DSAGSETNPLPHVGGYEKIAVQMGKYVTAGGTFESFQPGYQVVKIQRTMPRYELPVKASCIPLDARSFVLSTAARVEAVNYAITLPQFGSGNEQKSTEQIDLLADLTGIEATWQETSARTNWTGWRSEERRVGK